MTYFEVSSQDVENAYCSEGASARVLESLTHTNEQLENTLSRLAWIRYGSKIHVMSSDASTCQNNLSDSYSSSDKYTSEKDTILII